jgi:hypothetical protein
MCDCAPEIPMKSRWAEHHLRDAPQSQSMSRLEELREEWDVRQIREASSMVTPALAPQDLESRKLETLKG